jgi:hypothetical protein
MLQFVGNLCRHQVWECGSGISFFVLAYCAVFIFFEQMGDLPRVIKLLNFIRQFEATSPALTQEISMVREQLIRNAARLTNNADLIVRFRSMLGHDFHAITQHVRQLEVPTMVEDAGQALQNLEPLALP